VNRPPPPVWRSILYVPGNVPKFIDKAHERGADCILVDLEDSVTVAEKPTARAMLPETMKKVVQGGADVAVRINRPMRLAIPDLEAAVRPGLSALFVTKTEGVQHLRLLDEAVSELEREALIEVPDAEMGELPTHPVVPRMSGTPGALKSAAPKIGEHNEALLRPLLGDAEYQKLKQARVIK